MHHFERIFGTPSDDDLRLLERGDILAERLDGRCGTAVRRVGIAAVGPRAQVVGAQALEMDQELGHAALDCLEMAEPGLRGVELLDQPGDPIFEPAERKLLAARERIVVGDLQMLDLVAERSDQLIELGDLGRVNLLNLLGRLGGRGGASILHDWSGLRGLPAHLLDRVGDRADALVQRIENVDATRGGHAALDPVGEPAHLLGERRERVPRRHLPHLVAQRSDGAFELLQARRILPAGGELVDLALEDPQCLVEADQAFGRRQPAQFFAHLAQTLLEPGERRRIDPGTALGVEPPGERAHLGLQRLDGAARHRVRQRATDIGEIFSQPGNRILGPARHRLRQGAADVGQIFSQAGDRVLGAALHRHVVGKSRRRRRREWRWRRRGREGARRRRRGRREVAIERALARRDLGHHRIDAGRFGAGDPAPGEARAGPPLLLVEARNRALDAVDAPVRRAPGIGPRQGPDRAVR